MIIASSSMDRKSEASQFIPISGVFQFSCCLLGYGFILTPKCDV